MASLVIDQKLSSDKHHLHHQGQHHASVPGHQVQANTAHQPAHSYSHRMSRGYKPNTNHSIITSAIEGKSLGEIEKTWQDLAASEMRLKMMDSLIKYKVGFNEVEYFNLISGDKNSNISVVIEQ